MAKIKSIFKLSGKIGDLNFVQSKTYGNYTRAPRGTFKPAVVNDAFKASGNELKEAIPFAKLIKDSFNPYLTNFKDGKLWSRLRSLFRKELRNFGRVNYHLLKDLQFHEKNSLDSLLQGKIEVETCPEEEGLFVSLQMKGHPYFSLDYINAYQITLIVAGIPADSRKSHMRDHEFPLTKLDSPVMTEKQVLFLPFKKEVKTFIVVLRCNGYQDKYIMNNLYATGMAVLEVIEKS